MAITITEVVIDPTGTEVIKVTVYPCAVGCDKMHCNHGPRGPLGPGDTNHNTYYLTKTGQKMDSEDYKIWMKVGKQIKSWESVTSRY
jgi:hypothetical protein